MAMFVVYIIVSEGATRVSREKDYMKCQCIATILLCSPDVWKETTYFNPLHDFFREPNYSMANYGIVVWQ